MDDKSLVEKKNTDLLDSVFDNRFYNNINSLRNGLNSLFNSDLWSWSMDTRIFEEIQPKNDKAFPKVNVSETDENYEIDIAIAGFNKDDIDLELDNNYMIIKANCSTESIDENKKYLRKEISSRSFKRVIGFPETIDEDKITCSYKDGIVNCVVPKKEPVTKPDRVKIKIN